MTPADERSIFTQATESAEEINARLAETDKIGTVQYTGAVGYHVHIAAGDSWPGTLWKVAFLQAIDEAVLDMVNIEADTPDAARRKLRREISESFPPHTADYLCDRFEENLRSLIETQQARADQNENADLSEWSE